VRIDPFVQATGLVANDGATNDSLGMSVAVDGDTIVAGAPDHNSGAGNGGGAVYVFVKPASGWAGVTQWPSSSSLPGAAPVGTWGYSVAVSGDTVVAGDPGRTVDGHLSQGAAYVFSKLSSGWTETMTPSAELTARDGAADDDLGWSVAISGSTVVAGAPGHATSRHASEGAAYVFEQPGPTWTGTLTQNAELIASDGKVFDNFGWSVAASGKTVVVGAPEHAIDGNDAVGAAYVFTEPGTVWTGTLEQNAELLNSAGLAQDKFGDSLAVSGDTVLVGDPARPVGSSHDQGAAYAFVMPASGWSGTDAQDTPLTDSTGVVQESFGASVGVSGGTVVTGHSVATTTKEPPMCSQPRPRRWRSSRR
jgi:hypothetical protein